MKLVNRVSLFFLAALAIVLIVYSGGIYAIVRGRLHQEFERELHSALNSLVAAVEIEPEEVKWQPAEHTIALGSIQGRAEVRWAVIGDHGQVVETSSDVSPDIIAHAKEIAADADSIDRISRSDWQFLHQRLAAPEPDRSQRESDEFDEIVVVVAHSTIPLNADLNRLLLLVCTLPLAVWLVAATIGHWFCRRALQPVLDMAGQAQSITGANFSARLAVSETGDELTELAVAFNRLLDRQNRALEQQRRFAGDAAHELRTPLTVLLGQIDVILRRPRSSEEYVDTLTVLRDETIDLQKIVDSLLFLARTEEDSDLPDAETITLSTWLNDYLIRWNGHPRQPDIHLHSDLRPSCRIRVSAPLLAHLLDNLIENAVKYSSPGSAIEIITTCENDEAVIEVQDHGSGITVEDQAAIFDPFFRARAARDTGVAGAGLGLAIARRIAQAFSGKLTCTSEVGSGSQFIVRLPLAGSEPLLQRVVAAERGF